MIRRPPISTRTDTLFPDTTLFRAQPQPDRQDFRLARLHGPAVPPARLAPCRPARRRRARPQRGGLRSEEHTSELQSLMRLPYAVFCLQKKKQRHTNYFTTYLPRMLHSAQSLQKSTTNHLHTI